MNILEK